MNTFIKEKESDILKEQKAHFEAHKAETCSQKFIEDRIIKLKEVLKSKHLGKDMKQSLQKVHDKLQSKPEEYKVEQAAALDAKISSLDTKIAIALAAENNKRNDN